MSAISPVVAGPSDPALEALFTLPNLLVAHLDRDLRFVRVNEAYAAAAGRTPEFFPGRGHFELYPHAGDEAIFRRVLASGEPHLEPAKAFAYAHAPECGIRFCDWSLTPLRDPLGRVAGLLLVMQDVTPVRAAEADLRRRDTVLQTLSGVAERLIVGDSWEAVSGDMLAQLGRGTGAERICLFQNATADDSTAVARLCREWAAPGAQRPVADQEREDIPAALLPWGDSMPSGRAAPLQGPAGDFPAALWRRLTVAENAVLAFVPVGVGEEGWGFLVLSDCRPERVWSEAELGAVRTMALVLGASMRRQALVGALSHSERQLRDIVTLSPDLLFELELPGYQPIFISPAALELTGYQPHALMSAPGKVMRMLHRDDRRRVRQAFAAALEGGEGVCLEARLRHRDGGSRWCELRATVARDAVGMPLRVFGSLRDATARKLSEQGLAESEAAFRAVFDGALDGILIADVGTGRFRMANPAVCRMLGYDHDALLQLGVDDIHPPEALPRIVEEFRRQVAGSKALAASLPVLRRDGAVLYVDVTAAVTTIRGSQVAVGVFHDVSERKAAEDALQEAQRRLLASQRFARVGHWEMTLSDQRVIWSETARELLGLGSEPGPMPQALAEVVHVDDWARVKATLDQALAGDGLCQMRYRIRRGDGELRVVEGKGELERDAAGRPVRLLGVVQDITEREQARQAQHDILVETIGAMARALDKRDPYSGSHQQRVADLAVAIAREMGLDPGRIEGIRLGSIVHDIGNIAVPAEILNRPGPLSDSEREFIKVHPTVGAEIVAGIPFPWPVTKIIVQHHERLDGSGYPAGLRGDQILLEARVVAVADVVEAIASHRPYRPAIGVEGAFDYLLEHRGRLFDAEAADACVRLYREGRFPITLAKPAEMPAWRQRSPEEG